MNQEEEERRTSHPVTVFAPKIAAKNLDKIRRNSL